MTEAIPRHLHDMQVYVGIKSGPGIEGSIVQNRKDRVTVDSEEPRSGVSEVNSGEGTAVYTQDPTILFHDQKSIRERCGPLRRCTEALAQSHDGMLAPDAEAYVNGFWLIALSYVADAEGKRKQPDSARDTVYPQTSRM